MQCYEVEKKIDKEYFDEYHVLRPIIEEEPRPVDVHWENEKLRVKVKDREEPRYFDDVTVKLNVQPRTRTEYVEVPIRNERVEGQENIVEQPINITAHHQVLERQEKAPTFKERPLQKVEERVKFVVRNRVDRVKVYTEEPEFYEKVYEIKHQKVDVQEGPPEIRFKDVQSTNEEFKFVDYIETVEVPLIRKQIDTVAKVKQIELIEEYDDVQVSYVDRPKEVALPMKRKEL